MTGFQDIFAALNLDVFFSPHARRQQINWNISILFEIRFCVVLHIHASASVSQTAKCALFTEQIHWDPLAQIAGVDHPSPGRVMLPSLSSCGATFSGTKLTKANSDRNLGCTYEELDWDQSQCLPHSWQQQWQAAFKKDLLPAWVCAGPAHLQCISSEPQEHVSDPEHCSQAGSCPRPDIYQLFSQQLNPRLRSCALSKLTLNESS